MLLALMQAGLVPDGPVKHQRDSSVSHPTVKVVGSEICPCEVVPDDESKYRLKYCN
jgi:hypothetical protein